MLPPDILSLLESDESTLAVENGQLKQQLQGVQSQLEQATTLINTMQIDYKKAMDQTNLKGQYDIQKELIKQQTTLSDQKLQNSGDIMQELVKQIQIVSNKVQELEVKMGDKGESVSIETE